MERVSKERRRRMLGEIMEKDIETFVDKYGSKAKYSPKALEEMEEVKRKFYSKTSS